MGPLMYRQRPAYPALIFSVCVLVSGTAIAFWLKRQTEVGLAEKSSIMLVVCITIALASCGIVATFARYQFTHLWKKKQAEKPDEDALMKKSHGRW